MPIRARTQEVIRRQGQIAAIYAERIRSYNDFLRKRLAAFGKTDVESLISPGLEILEGKHVHKHQTLSTLTVAQRMNTTWTRKPMTLLETLMSPSRKPQVTKPTPLSNTLAITTPKSKKDDRVSPISIDIKTIITYKNAGGIGQVTPLNIAVHRIRFFNTNG